jgi:hypothetical protein
MAVNSLFLLPTVSGVLVNKPEEVSFSASIIPANIEVIPVIISEETVEQFKRAAKNGNQTAMMSLLDELYMDGALLVRALVESAIEYINIGSPATVSLILESTRESMKPDVVMQIVQLLIRTQKSGKYAEFVAQAETSHEAYYMGVRACLQGKADPPQVEGWESLRGCALRYQAYPFFAAAYAKEEKPAKLPRLTARTSKKAAELAVIR